MQQLPLPPSVGSVGGPPQQQKPLTNGGNGGGVNNNNTSIEVAFCASLEVGFFGRKCCKINHSKSSLSFLVPIFIQSAFAEKDAIGQFAHDSTRNILYARTEKGSIQSYDLGQDGSAMNRVASVSPSQMVQAAANIARYKR